MPTFPTRIAPLGLLIAGLYLSACGSGSPGGSGPPAPTPGVGVMDGAPDAGAAGGRDVVTPDVDSDRDGVPDAIEDANHNHQVDPGETDPLDADSDDDGLPDGLEDSNRDGRVDPGETDPRKKDSDEDGLPDGLERGVTQPVTDPDGDGPARGTDPTHFTPDADPTTTTSPTQRDTDGDGVADGDEDRSRDGKIDGQELDPGARDTDGDGIGDGDEGLALVCASERLRPVMLRALASADLTLALPADYSEVSVLREMDGRGVGFMFRNPATGVVGFAVSKSPEASDVQAEKQADRRRLDAAANLSDEQDRALRTWDGFPAVWTTATAERRRATAVEVAAEMARRVSGADALAGALPGGGGSPGAFTAQFETILRTPSRAIVVGALVDAPATEASSIALADVANGTPVAQFGDFTGLGCDPFQSPPGNDVVDLLWVVDNSCSMAEEQRNVAAAGNEMVALLSTTQLSWRLGLVTTDDDDLTCCGVDGFTPSFPRATAEAASQAWATAVGRLGTGGDGEERGATIGLTAARAALPATATEEKRRFRQGASVIVVHMSDEEDFTVKEASGGNDQRCPDTQGKQDRIQELIDGYLALARDPSIAGLTTFAIHGIQPNPGEDPCSFEGSADCGGASQYGRSYVDIASALGGGTGSICGNMGQIVQDIIRAGAGIASSIVLSQPPISSTIRVVMADEAGRFTGRPDVPRARHDGFDYAFSVDGGTNAVEHKIVFYGSARPPQNRDLLISYRTWKDASPDPGAPDCPCAGGQCDADTNACTGTPSCGECRPGEYCDSAATPPRCVSL